MSDAKGLDILMKVVGPNGALAAQSSTVFATKPVMDLLRSGFTPGQFCDLQAFSFSAGVESSLSGGAKTEEAAGDGAGEGRPTYRQKMEGIYRSQRDKAEARAGVDRQGNRRTEFVDMQPVEFTRVMDTMSPELFKALTACDTLDSISVVKRKAAGSANSGDCYLRLDFSKVLLTNLVWTDGEQVVIETGTFIYRKLTLRYRPQKADGSLGVAIQAEWEMKSAAAATAGR